MRRPSSHTRYDILTSAEAWSLIGTLRSEEFAGVQAEIEKLAWSAFALRAPDGKSTTRINIKTDWVTMVCDVDHVAHRVTVVTLMRSERVRSAADDDDAEDEAEVRPEPRVSGGAGKKR
jgi:hypothetical protein